VEEQAARRPIATMTGVKMRESFKTGSTYLREE
jgi:hypothetical protein